MKRIILFTDSLVAAGAQRQLVLLAKCLKEDDYNVMVVTYTRIDQLSDNLNQYNIPWLIIQKRLKLDLLFIWRLFLFFKRENPDVIISYLDTPNMWARLIGRAAGINKIITSKRNLDYSKLRQIIEIATFRLGNCIVANSYAIKNQLISIGIPQETINVIYNGVDTTYFSQCNEVEINKFRNTYGLSINDFVIVLPGRLALQKNHIGLLDAIDKLNIDQKSLKVLFVGNELDLDIKNTLKQRIVESNITEKIIFCGHLENMPLVYSASDLVVLPSLWEGFPNAVIEAMSCSRPVIASDISDNSAIINHGVSGYIYSVGNSDALAQYIDDCFNMPRDKLHAMGIQGQQKICELCSIEKFKKSYDSIIQG